MRFGVHENVLRKLPSHWKVFVYCVLDFQDSFKTFKSFYVCNQARKDLEQKSSIACRIACHLKIHIVYMYYIAALTPPDRYFDTDIGFDGGYQKHLVRFQWSDNSWFKSIIFTCEPSPGTTPPQLNGNSLCSQDLPTSGFNHTVRPCWLQWNI